MEPGTKNVILETQELEGYLISRFHYNFLRAIYHPSYNQLNQLRHDISHLTEIAMETQQQMRA